MVNKLITLGRKKRIWLTGIILLALIGLSTFPVPGASWPRYDGAPWKKDVQTCGEGDWGNLWYEPSIIELPPDRIRVLPFAQQVTSWYLPTRKSLELAATLESCGLNVTQQRDLLLTLTPAPDGIGSLLTPPESLILSLSPDIRSRLYGVLGRSPQNDAQVSPFRFNGDATQDWLEGADLEAGVTTLIRSLIYRHGNTQYFSDMATLLNRYPSSAVYSNVFHVLSREATLVARVHVFPDDDVDALASYWGVPHREDEVRTLIKTLQGTEACRDVPVSMLLPPFARDRLYRYWHEGDPEFASCHYTAMNFLNENADGRFTNLTEVATTLARDYVEVTGNYRLGDIILLMKNANEAIHSCNFVADQIVFTRNGGNQAKPWMFTTLNALVDYYSYPDPVHIKVMRRRDLIPRFAAGNSQFHQMHN